jgi:hypothetical protein
VSHLTTEKSEPSCCRSSSYLSRGGVRLALNGRGRILCREHHTGEAGRVRELSLMRAVGVDPSGARNARDFPRRRPRTPRELRRFVAVRQLAVRLFCPDRQAEALPLPQPRRGLPSRSRADEQAARGAEGRDDDGRRANPRMGHVQTWNADALSETAHRLNRAPARPVGGGYPGRRRCPARGTAGRPPAGPGPLSPLLA